MRGAVADGGGSARTTNAPPLRSRIGSRLGAASRSPLVRPVLAGVVFSVTALLWAPRGADEQPLLPSVQWSGLLHPLVISVTGGLVTFAVARRIETPRRQGDHVRWGRGFLTVITLVAAAACLSWGTAGLTGRLATGQWAGLAAGLVLASLSAHSYWRLRRRRE